MQQQSSNSGGVFCAHTNNTTQNPLPKLNHPQPNPFQTTKKQKIMAEARELLPGGVNSPVRAFRSVGGNPIVFDRVKGPYCWDVDGNKYVDYIGSWGPAIVGAANDEVNAVLKEQIEKGTSFGAPGPLENVLAKMVIERVPSVEMVRFVSSGTEACLSVLRLMRAYTKREKVIKFVGCYHGHADSFLVKAGSGVATLGLPDSPGVPASTAAATLTATYNDLASVKALFEANKGEVAGVILEPVVGNSGFIVPTQEFLEGLRELTNAEGALLCFDEVMTGFRIAKGCAQEHFGITPDLTTMGKVIGGGLPVGAYGGRRDIMELVAPAGPMYQAGTLSGAFVWSDVMGSLVVVLCGWCGVVVVLSCAPVVALASCPITNVIPLTPHPPTPIINKITAHHHPRRQPARDGRGHQDARDPGPPRRV
jgi:glutamate-1-semialdehyde 2,1-aminomutase